ncbi:hypothetical protein [Halorientalis salina]|uniref:hypothetical protein n=1 Tax=Halorientalis salina TaxID=2932266 RepID=UPI0010ACA27D|nr:hypothetical protein [Halorientalis salina]
MGFRWRVPVFVAVVAVLAVALALGGGSAAPTAPTTAVATSATQAGADPPPERWNRTYGATAGRFNDVESTPNGTVLAAGSILASGGTELDGWVVNATTNGTERWNRTYGGSEDDVINDAVPTDDGGALLVGTSVSRGPGGEDGWVLKIDRRGDVEWRIATGGPGDDGFAAVERTRDGYLAAGTYADGENTDGWLAKVETDGTLAWTKRYDVRVGDSISTIERRPTGGYVLAGETASVANPRPKGLVLTVDADGTQRRRHLVGGSASDRFLAARATPDGGMVLTGATRSFGAEKRQGWAVRLDANGSERWSRVYETGPLSDVVPAADGGFLLAGETNPASGFGDGALVRVGAGGDPSWSRTYGGSSYESFAGIDAAPGGGFVVAGESGTDRGWPGTAWLLRIGGPELATPLEPPGTPGDGSTTPDGETPAGGPMPGTATGTPDAAAPPASGDDGGDEMSLVSILLVVGVVSIFFAGFLFLLWDLADNPLRTIDRRTPLVDLTVVFNRFGVGENSKAGPDAAGAGRNVDGRGEAGSGPDGFGGAGGSATAGSADGTAGFGAAGGSTADAGAGFGGAGEGSTDPTDEPIDVGGGASTAAGAAGASSSAGQGGTAQESGADAGAAGPESDAGDGDWEYPGGESIAESVAASTDLVVAGSGDEESSVPATRAPVPGTFTLRNGGSRALICRFRCHTTDEVVFDYWVEVEPGATRRAHATPTDAPFEILINVEDDLLASQVFVNNDRGGANVTATVSEDAIDISLTEDLADSPLAEADDHESPTDDDALAGVGADERSGDAESVASEADADASSVETAGEPDEGGSSEASDDLNGDLAAEDGDGWTPDVEVAEPEPVAESPGDGDAAGPAEGDDAQLAESEDAALDEAVDADPLAAEESGAAGSDDESSVFAGDEGAETETDEDGWTPDVEVTEPEPVDEGSDPAEPESVGEPTAAEDDSAEDPAVAADERTAEPEAAGTDGFETAWTDETAESVGETDTGTGGIDSSQAGDIDSSQLSGPAEADDADATDEADDVADAETGESDPGDEDGDEWATEATDESDGGDADDVADAETGEPETGDEDGDEWTAEATDESDDEGGWTVESDDGGAEPEDPWMEDVDIDTGESDDGPNWTDEVDDSGMDGIGSSWDETDDDSADAGEDWPGAGKSGFDDLEDLDDDWAGDLEHPDDDEDGGDDGGDGDDEESAEE